MVKKYTRRTPRQLARAQFDKGNVAKRVKYRRVLNGLSIAELATKAGLSRSMISKIENRSGDVMVSTLASIAKVLKVRVGYLLWGE